MVMYSESGHSRSYETRKWKDEEMSEGTRNRYECKMMKGGCGNMGYHNCPSECYSTNGGGHGGYSGHGGHGGHGGPGGPGGHECRDQGRHTYWDHCRDDRRDDCRELHYTEYEHKKWADCPRECRNECKPGCDCGCQYCCTSDEKAQARRKKLRFLQGFDHISAEEMCKLKEVMGGVMHGLLGARPCHKVVKVQSSMCWIDKFLEMNRDWAMAHNSSNENKRWTMMILPMVQRVAKCLEDQDLRKHLAENCGNEAAFEQCKGSCDSFIQLALAMASRMKHEQDAHSFHGMVSHGQTQKEILEALVAISGAGGRENGGGSGEGGSSEEEANIPMGIEVRKEDLAEFGDSDGGNSAEEPEDKHGYIERPPPTAPGSDEMQKSNDLRFHEGSNDFSTNSDHESTVSQNKQEIEKELASKVMSEIMRSL